LGLIKKVKLNLNKYRDYLLWQIENKVTVERVKTGWKSPPNVELPTTKEPVPVNLGLEDLLGESVKPVQVKGSSNSS